MADVVEIEEGQFAFYTDNDKWSMDLLGSYNVKDKNGVWPTYEEAEHAAMKYEVNTEEKEQNNRFRDEVARDIAEDWDLPSDIARDMMEDWEL